MHELTLIPTTLTPRRRERDEGEVEFGVAGRLRAPADLTIDRLYVFLTFFSGERVLKREDGRVDLEDRDGDTFVFDVDASVPGGLAEQVTHVEVHARCSVERNTPIAEIERSQVPRTTELSPANPPARVSWPEGILSLHHNQDNLADTQLFMVGRLTATDFDYSGSFFAFAAGKFAALTGISRGGIRHLRRWEQAPTPKMAPPFVDSPLGRCPGSSDARGW